MARNPSPGPEERCFQVWRDYFQLARVVAELGKLRDQEPEGPPGNRTPPRGAGAPGVPQEAPETAGPAERVCSFCRHNGESRTIYASHSLRDAEGRVRCPILRRYTCPQCGACGDRAHTRRFCPLTRQGYTSVYHGSQRNAAGRKKAAAKF